MKVGKIFVCVLRTLLSVSLRQSPILIHLLPTLYFHPLIDSVVK